MLHRFDYRLIRQLLLWAVVAEEKSFRRAAARLNMSLPPVTAQVDELEDRLRVKLLVRTPRGVKLTAAGEAFMPEVRRFLASAEMLDYAVKELQSGGEGVLTVGAVSEAMLGWMPDFQARLAAALPRLSVFTKEIDSADVVKALLSNEVLLAVGHFKTLSEATLATRCIRLEKPVVMVARSHWAAERGRASLAEFAQEDWVMPGRELSPDYLDILSGLCVQHGFHARVKHRVGSTMRQMAFAACGQGIALAPAWFAEMAPSSVCVVELTDVDPVIPLTAAWNPAVSSPQRDAALRFVSETPEA